MQRLFKVLITTVSLAVGLTLPLGATQAAEVPAAAPVMAQLLFVQNAQGFEVGADGRTLTLKGLSPTTLFFSDRPVRIAGHYLTGEYLQFWKAGPDSFLKDPPNATLSVFEKGKDELSDVVVTLRNPRVNGNDLSYDITVIAGTLPKTSGPASLFIDIIGLPFTPLSFAGVARRTAYRTVVWGSAAHAAAPVVYATPAPTTVHITETVQAPPAAPTVNPAQAAAVAKLKELKSLQTQGLISEAQYQTESQKLLSQIVQ
ncbi:MAG TPA: hypothetical protein VET87_12280 [Rubrivivax sp.]|nr:hypothetical protein [Rubrivivax sp.]